MPRISSSAKDVANRFVTKAIALKDAYRERAECVQLMEDHSDDPKSLAFRTGSNGILRIDTDIDSIVNTLLGMHQKLITSDVDSFLSFVQNVAEGNFLDECDAK